MSLWRLLWLTCLVALGGCKVDPVNLAPFPCPKDADCPAGLACRGGSCVRACQDGEGCLSSEACTEPAGRGVCVIACASDPASCAAEETCQSLHFGGLKGCLPATDAGLSPCAEVKVAACGAGNLCDGQYTTDCHDGTFCPSRGACLGPADGGTCGCDDGYEAVGCDGQSCDGRACSLFWCRVRDVAARCRASPTPTTQLTCVCKDAAKNAAPHVLACGAAGDCFTYCSESN